MSGNYDTIIAGMSITAERKDEVIDFTQRLHAARSLGLRRALGPTWTLPAGVVAAQTKHHPGGLYHREQRHAGGVRDAGGNHRGGESSGEADAVLADKAYLDPIVAESGGELVEVGTVLIGGGVGMGVRESDTELKAKFDAAIQSMKDDGTLNELIAKHSRVGEPF